MDEKRIEDEVYAGLSAPIHGFSAYTAPKATVGLIQNSRAIAKKGLKKAGEEMAKELAKKRAIRAIGKLGVKMGAKHLAGLAPAATGIGAIAVPVLQAGLLASDIYNLYNLSKDKDFRNGIQYLSQDALDGIKNTAKGAVDRAKDLVK